MIGVWYGVLLVLARPVARMRSAPKIANVMFLCTTLVQIVSHEVYAMERRANPALASYVGGGFGRVSKPGAYCVG